MEEYRLYFLGPEGRFSRAVAFACCDDQHAIETVAEHRDGFAMELWQRDRLVSCFEADSAP